MPQSSDPSASWLSLCFVPGLGNRFIHRLVETFGSPEGVLAAGHRDLLRVEGMKEEVVQRIRNRAFLRDPVEELAAVRRLGARLIPWGGPEYPASLKEIPSPPVLLYARGREIPKGLPLVAVIGSRLATPYGLKSAERIAYGLARRGIGVVSGMAKGIDAAAHLGCLMGGGFTAGVLGTGIDIAYPYENKKLFGEMFQKGTLLSEYPLGTPPEPRNFPIRNRIISGLSMGVVVVEASRQSGSLITASMALEQGREVFAVPGSIHSFKSSGTNLLIKQGARLVENAEDILGEFGYDLLEKGPQAEKEEDALQGLTQNEKSVYQHLGEDPLHIDEIARSTGLPASVLAGVLLQLELRGLVRQLQGKHFVR